MMTAAREEEDDEEEEEEEEAEADWAELNCPSSPRAAQVAARQFGWLAGCRKILPKSWWRKILLALQLRWGCN